MGPLHWDFQRQIIVSIKSALGPPKLLTERPFLDPAPLVTQSERRDMTDDGSPDEEQGRGVHRVPYEAIRAVPYDRAAARRRRYSKRALLE